MNNKEKLLTFLITILLYVMLTAFGIAVIYIIFTKPDAHRMPIAVRSEHSAIRNTTLWSLVEKGSNHALVTLDFYDIEDSVFVGVTLDAPYLSKDDMVGYQICGRSHIVVSSNLDNHTIPSSIIDTTLLQTKPDDVINRCSDFDHICLGWGEIMVYRIENDSLVFDHTEIIE